MQAIRRFNRFYTRRVGALNARFLGTELTLPEARLLFEIVQGDKPLASYLQRGLGMDGGYVSRVLARFEARGYIDLGGYPAVKRWFDTMAARPAVQRGVQVLAEGRYQRAITDAEREVYFGKTQFQVR